MKKMIVKYSGALLLYSVVIFGVIAINARCKYLNNNIMKGEGSNLVAIQK